MGAGQVVDVSLIDVAGRRRIYGFQGFVNSALSEVQIGEALSRAHTQGFLDVGE